MTVVLLYPLASAICYSFLRYYLGGGAPVFIGFTNYVDLLEDPGSGATFSTTVIIVGASVLLQLSWAWHWPWRCMPRRAACG